MRADLRIVPATRDNAAPVRRRVQRCLTDTRSLAHASPGRGPRGQPTRDERRSCNANKGADVHQVVQVFDGVLLNRLATYREAWTSETHGVRPQLAVVVVA